MQSKIHTRALSLADQALRNGPWRDTPWDERSRRFGSALLTALRESLATLQPMTAVSAACTAARGELPLASPLVHAVVPQQLSVPIEIVIFVGLGCQRRSNRSGCVG